MDSTPRDMAVWTPQDRSISVPPGHRVVTGYVPIDQISIACRARMAIGDVETSYRKQLALGDHQAWPCPNGRWNGDKFVIHDGRHAYVAALMIGLTHLLVAWTEGAADAAIKPGPSLDDLRAARLAGGLQDGPFLY